MAWDLATRQEVIVTRTTASTQVERRLCTFFFCKVVPQACYLEFTRVTRQALNFVSVCICWCVIHFWSVIYLSIHSVFKQDESCRLTLYFEMPSRQGEYFNSIWSFSLPSVILNNTFLYLTLGDFTITQTNEDYSKKISHRAYAEIA